MPRGRVPGAHGQAPVAAFWTMAATGLRVEEFKARAGIPADKTPLAQSGPGREVDRFRHSFTTQTCKVSKAFVLARTS